MSGRRTTAGTDPARIDGRAASVAAALERAALLLGRARRGLVVGLADVTLEAIVAACDLAESLGAAIDAGSPAAASPLGPVVARAGAVNADREELRDRSDLVIVWFCDPDACQPGFAAEYLDRPLPDGSLRQVLAVGPAPVAGAGVHILLPARAAVDAARGLHAVLLGHQLPLDNPAAALVAAGCHDLVAAIRGAACVGFITCRPSDPLDLGDWATSLLVRTVAHERPAFAVPLAAPPFGPSTDAAGAVAILTWRYGAAGAIARADRMGGDFRPAECSAATLIARGECDAVLAVGKLPADVEEAIRSRAADLAVVRIDDRADEPPGCAGPCVHLRGESPPGTVRRDDGRLSMTGEPAASASPDPVAALLNALRQRLAPEDRP